MKAFSKNQFSLPCRGLLVALLVLISFPCIQAYSASSSENYYYQSPPPTVSHHYSQNYTHIVNVVGAVYCHNRTHIEGVTVKVTCMTSDKNIEAYGRTNIHGKYNITIEAYGIDTCMAKVHIVPEGSPCKMPTDFDAAIEPLTSYTLAVQWPYGVCSGSKAAAMGLQCLTPIPIKFTIHGLWPTPDHKIPIEFDIKKLEDIKTLLDAKWPDLFQRTDQSRANAEFWKYEWMKHGRDSKLDQLNYFKKALEFYDGLRNNDPMKNLLEILQTGGINPNNAYRVSRFTRVLADSKLKRPRYVCERRRLGTRIQLTELRFKYSPSFQPITNSGETDCGDDPNPLILFPGSLPVGEGNDEPALLKMNHSSPHRKIGVFAE